SHLPLAAQWKPPGQLVVAPGAGLQDVMQASGGGTVLAHKLSNVFSPPQAAVSTTRPTRRTRDISKRYSIDPAGGSFLFCLPRSASREVMPSDPGVIITPRVGSKTRASSNICNTWAQLRTPPM